MPKSLDPKLELEIHRDILRKDASISVAKAVVDENPYTIADLLDQAMVARQLLNRLDDEA